jgi:nucleoside-diphosphate-sugar epimerase
MPDAARVLITGGCGFIGANLVRAELDAGSEVHLLLRPEARLWRLTDLAGDYVAHEADVRDAAAVRRVVAVVRPEVVYHLATHGAYPFQKDRTEVLATNLNGTLHLLDALAGRDYRALVHTGSSSEYGHKPGPMRECDVLEPRTDYAVSKASAALACLAAARRGEPVTVVRVFSAYGPWEEPSRFVPYVLDCCMRGIVPRITAGVQPRDFVHVEDVVALLRLAARRPDNRGRILHAGTGIETTVRQMAGRIAELTGGPAPLIGSRAPRPDEPEHWVASIDETAARTGWRPRYAIDDGIRGMAAWWLECQRRVAC